MTSKILIIAILIFALFLRAWNTVNYPAGFNADEAAIGYNAYSILQTGKDEYGEVLPLVFKSFGDYKPGLYFYFVIPFIAILGVNELAVRLPAIIFSVATICFIYLLAVKVSGKQLIGLIAALLLAITPWHFHFSRGGWESNVATFFITSGVLFFIYGLEKGKFLALSLLLFLMSMYTYQSPRLIIPLLLFILFLLYRKNILGKIKEIRFYIPLLFIISIPLILQFTSGGATARFSGLSFFADPGPELRTNELRGEHRSLDSKESQILHNKLTAYGPNLLGHYLDHFKPSFLFINGDEVERNKIPEAGQLFLIESIFLVLALLFLTTSNYKYKDIIIVWLLIAPVASSITFQTPSALRSLNLVIPLTLLVSIGIFESASRFKNKYFFSIFSLIIILVLTFELTHYLESYFVHYPKRYPLAWEYGFREMVGKLEKYQSEFDKVVITDKYDQPYILTLFYLKYPPEKYQPQAKLTTRDKFNFGTVRSFEKYEFRIAEKDEIQKAKNTLYIITEEKYPNGSEIIDKVLFPSGQVAFIFVKT